MEIYVDNTAFVELSIDTTKSLKMGVYMNWEVGTKLWLPFRYERLSDFCYKYGRIEHTETACIEYPQLGDDCSDPRIQFRPRMCGQYIGTSKNLENKTPIVEK